MPTTVRDVLRRRTALRGALWDATIGGALGALLVAVLAFSDNAFRRLALDADLPGDIIVTLCLSVVAQFAVGAALSGFILRMFDEAERR
jgi:uncharacterized integral membrane protein